MPGRTPGTRASTPVKPTAELTDTSPVGSSIADPPMPRAMRLVLAATAATLALFVAWLAVPALGHGPGTPDVVESALYLLVTLGATVLVLARARAGGRDASAWWALGAALACGVAGNLLWSLRYDDLAEPPYPSLADAAWLAAYPLYYLSIALLARARLGRFVPSMWLDGLVVGLAFAAVAAAVAYDSVIDATSGAALTVATTLAYPVADLLLLLIIAAVLGAVRLRGGRALVVLGAGLLVTGVADSIYLLGSSAGTYEDGQWIDGLWPAGALLMALAAWQPPAPPVAEARDGWANIALPTVAGLIAVLVLVLVSGASEHTLTVVLSAAAIVASIGRTTLTFRELRQLGETRRLALTDELTGLANRRALLRRIDRAVARGERIALLLVDLDRFKELNDTLGHPVGDVVLRAVGRRLGAVLAPDALLARLGGDEFAVVCATDDPAAAVRVGERLRETLDRPIEADGVLAQLEASIGVALHPLHAPDATGLLQRADVAMYEAKRERTGVEVYAETRDEHSRQRVAVLGQLRVGIDRDELVVHLQPQVDTRTGRLIGAEALVRWAHPERGLLAPGAFLPAVEHTTVMRPMTDRVLRDALAARAALAAAGLPVTMAVNVAAPNLLDTAFPERVARALHASGVAPGELCLEVTEHAVMSDHGRASACLEALRRVGVLLALDDFGVGHSSLANLKRLPVDELKVDRSFVAAMAAGDPRDAMIVRLTAELGNAFGLRVVAEGIEDAAALAPLAALGCHAAQGYGIGRPMPLPQFLAWAGAWTARERPLPLAA